MFKLVNLLVFILLLYSTVYAQSDDDFLSDFGGDDFEEIESELDLVTTNVVEEKSSDNSIEKKSTSESFDWDAIFSQKLYYGLEYPSAPFLRRAPGIEAIHSNINLGLNTKFAEVINFKLSGDVNWDWGGYFESTKYSYGPTSADFMLRDLFIDFYPIDGLWLRVGNQIIARGESNLLISSDIANPRDLSTIGLQDLDDIRLHIPSILAAYNIGSVKQEIIVFLDEKRNKVARPGTAFDPAAAFLGASIITNASPVQNNISYALRNKILLSGFELDLSLGEYNNKQLSTLSSSVSGNVTTLNTEQDRIIFLGLSGNIAFSDFVLKFDTSHKKGKRFPYSNPLVGPWSENEVSEFSLSADYSGLRDLSINIELASAYIHNHSAQIANKQNEYGYSLRFDWRLYNDLLDISLQHANILGDNGSFSSVSAAYELSDSINIGSKFISFDSYNSTQQLYPYRHQDLIELTLDYYFN
ncbi:MAG: DUF1302 family protein [Pseudomonadota bacterium]|nr:DUF1302 family protein [Pseudomonadota bacterium]